MCFSPHSETPAQPQRLFHTVQLLCDAFMVKYALADIVTEYYFLHRCLGSFSNYLKLVLKLTS